MKRSISLFLVLVLVLCACGKKKETAAWQEQYDLGVRYLTEGNYEQAILAFEAAIEIDPKQADAYIALAEVYTEQGDIEKATEILARAVAEIGETEELTTALALQETSLRLQEKLWPAVCDLVLPMTVDDIVLGETHIETAKAVYSSYPHAISNRMNDETKDTVYTCFGMNDMPVPEGYVENMFGFLFAAPVDGTVNYIVLNQPGLTAFHALQVGDGMGSVLTFFGFSSEAPPVSLQWTLNNGAHFYYERYGESSFRFIYRLKGQEADVDVYNGVLYSVTLTDTNEPEAISEPTPKLNFETETTNLRSERKDYEGGTYVILEYDTRDILVKETWYYPDGTIWYIDELLGSGYMETIVSYDLDGTMMQYEYDDKGNQVRDLQYNEDGSLKYYWIHEYDAEGNKVSWIQYNPDGTVKHVVEF